MEARLDPKACRLDDLQGRKTCFLAAFTPWLFAADRTGGQLERRGRHWDVDGCELKGRREKWC